jgi:DNA-directed RNA polymerase specialized sigma24 family protein
VTRTLAGAARFVAGPGPFQPWLYQIAAGAISGADHASRGRPAPAALGSAAHISDRPAAGDQEFGALRDRVPLQDALAGLAQEQRSLVLLHRMEGWEAVQVAQIV